MRVIIRSVQAMFSKRIIETWSIEANTLYFNDPMSTTVFPTKLIMMMTTMKVTSPHRVMLLSGPNSEVRLVLFDMLAVSTENIMSKLIKTLLNCLNNVKCSVSYQQP